MCGIAGFSLNAGSKVNARSLAHNLLTSIEARGRHASGIAYHNHHENRLRFHKGPVAGSNLPLKHMPRDTRTAVMHTRYATQGSPEVNENNHPVISPNKSIALVHNGVIWNDHIVRREQLEGVELPQVDTSVIPALLESQGLQGIQHISGDAAIAWLDIHDLPIMHLARIESSPVSYTNLEDGSFVFASTGSLLRDALDESKLLHGEVFTLSELDYFQIKGGVIWKYDQTPETAMWGRGVAASTRHATAGGSGSTPSSNTSIPKESGRVYMGGTVSSTPKPGAVGSTFFGSGNNWPGSENAADKVADGWTEDDDKALADAMEKIGLTPMFKAGDEYEDTENPNGSDEPAYYTVDHDGNMKTYDDLDELETALIYAAGRSEGDFGQGMSKWVNTFSDVGSFGFKEGELLSWVDEPTEIGYHEEMSTDGLSYIKDGIGILQSMGGR